MMYQEKLKYDWITIGLYFAIMLFGWINIYAAGYSEEHTGVFDFSVQHGKQIIWIAIALLLAAVIILTEPRVFSNTAYPIYGIVMVLLVVTLFIATVTKGGKSWIDFGAFKFQPSEFAKFATALAVAKYMSAIDLDLNNLRTKMVVAMLIAIPAALIFLQHDTGSALVFLGLAVIVVLAVLYLFVWLNKRTSHDYWRTIIVAVCCVVFVFSVDIVFNNILEPHQRERIDVLLGKSDDIKGSGYNVNQSKIAIGSGGLVGKGFLNGTLTKADFVPEQETDFIFCTVGEEWGFLGCVLLLVLYNLLLQRLIVMAERQRSTFARVYGYAVTSILFIHLFVNVGMVLGLVPVIGIPLPYFSYGGSSLLAFTVLLFIFIRQDASRNQLL